MIFSLDFKFFCKFINFKFHHFNELKMFYFLSPLDLLKLKHTEDKKADSFRNCHRSAILNFLERLLTELVCTVLPHSLTLDATILEAMLTGRSFSFLISKALELALT
jgi:hypothetical protein